MVLAKKVGKFLRAPNYLFLIVWKVLLELVKYSVHLSVEPAI